jgi:hypothetical protein
MNAQSPSELLSLALSAIATDPIGQKGKMS